MAVNRHWITATECNMFFYIYQCIIIQCKTRTSTRPGNYFVVFIFLLVTFLIIIWQQPNSKKKINIWRKNCISGIQIKKIRIIREINRDLTGIKIFLFKYTAAIWRATKKSTLEFNYQLLAIECATFTLTKIFCWSIEFK